MNQSIAFVNGEFCPLETATISVMDRGFLFGDGVYEVIPVYGGNLFRMQEHLDRLENSLRLVRIPNPWTGDRWVEVLNEIVQRNGGANQSLYLQVTRGVAPVRDHKFPEQTVPSVFIMTSGLESTSIDELAKGFSAITLDDIRWAHCNIKAITLLPNVLLRQTAVDGGHCEAILLRDGCAIEGTASNLFVVADGTLLTPPKGPLLLPGITRDLVLELAVQNGIPYAEQPVSETALRQAEEIWITSSTKEIIPVTKLDGQPVGDGVAGPIWNRLIRIYQDYKHTLSNQN